MIKVSFISTQKIRDGKFSKQLPELYELKNIIENSEWHVNDSIFSHTLKVLDSLEKNLKSSNKKIDSCLNKKIDNHTRKKVLYLATALHDIGKKETIHLDGEITSFAGHAEIGYLKAKNILDRFDLSGKEKNTVLEIIKNHGIFHDLVNPDEKELDKKFEEFKKEKKNIFLELVLFAMSDTMGCELRYNNPEKFKFKIKFYQNVLNRY